MATKKTVSRSKTQGKAAKAPADVLRDAKARIEEANKVPIPRMPTGIHPATVAARHAGMAREEVGALQVPVTLAEICALMGPDCHSEEFASTALETLAGQLYAVASLAENGGTYDGWRVVENITERMKLASRVTAWLQSETPEAATTLPEVTP